MCEKCSMKFYSALLVSVLLMNNQLCRGFISGVTGNTHGITTRSKNGIFKPKVLIATREPDSVEEALATAPWKTVMQEEYRALMNDQTWPLVPLPPGRQAIDCKWAFKMKENSNGTIQKYKFRLVAKGFHQAAGFDFNETFSPVIKPITVRVILTIVV